MTPYRMIRFDNGQQEIAGRAGDQNCIRYTKSGVKPN